MQKFISARIDTDMGNPVAAGCGKKHQIAFLQPAAINPSSNLPLLFG
jgi:hypothetical protein